MDLVCLNGKFISAEKPVLRFSNRGFRYGDALFETMKMINGRIPLWQYHVERLFAGLQILKFKVPQSLTKEKLKEDIIYLSANNKCEKLARIRLTVFRGNGNLNDEDIFSQYLIEISPADDPVNHLNDQGMRIDIFPEAMKSCDKFSNLKSANYLPFVMAALHAKENGWDDCLILNTHERICESTIANIFWIKGDIIYTPPLSEGCVAGVMRKFLLERLKDKRYKVQERILTSEDLSDADEIFLTNAIYNIRWIGKFQNKQYGNKRILKVYNEFIHPFFR